MSLREIERVTGIPKSTIRQTLKRKEMTRRRFAPGSESSSDSPKGKPPGAAPYGYGWLEGQLVKDPKEYNVVLEIIKMWQQTFGVRAIAKSLNDARVKSRTGKAWSHCVVRAIISREMARPNEKKLEDLNPAASNFISTVRSADKTQLYGSTLILQANLYKRELRNFLDSRTEWKQAKSILEVGCGPGEGARALSDEGLLNGKDYLGVDVEAAFVKKATDRNIKSKGMSFSHGDILTNNFGKYDLILSIAVLQHLGELNYAIERLRLHLNDQGTLIFFDAGSDNISESQPPVPVLKEMYNHISAKATGGKRNDKCLIELQERASDLGLQVILSQDVKMPVSESMRDQFIKYSFFTSELSKRFYQSPISQENLLDELIQWKSKNGKASLTGWRWLVAKKL